MNKAEILSALEDSHAKLLQAIEGLTPEEMTKPEIFAEWSVKDVLAHISRWEADLIRILFEIQQGSKVKIPDYSQSDVDRLNAQFVQESRARTLQQVMADFLAVRKQTIKRIEQFSENDLTDPKRFAFLNGTSLAQFIAADTYEHDFEHADQIQTWRKQSVRSS